jgi:hypothetical protein
LPSAEEATRVTRVPNTTALLLWSRRAGNQERNSKPTQTLPDEAGVQMVLNVEDGNCRQFEQLKENWTHAYSLAWIGIAVARGS